MVRCHPCDLIVEGGDGRKLVKRHPVRIRPDLGIDLLQDDRLLSASDAEFLIAVNSVTRRRFDGSNNIHTGGFTTPDWASSTLAPSISTVLQALEPFVRTDVA